ncbi:phosphoadenosine phosphosulfate reductase family protein [Caminibacter pacificus]|uniref:Phosphoadenosine phosphosulfate reductase family protein n=1 Tax=Caminibacter pacificus TaxID=1424653 RepID=A0AAJ4RB23_9BACT|nr:phosphoadenosine phosphosulfate reductase family protein [Caminibacter pacificus]ROR38695.1 phosphoadenosine phosphosulfate reductase family protein [Caminibacter pacificus]
MTDYRDIIQNIKNVVADFLQKDYAISVAFSGGKDSTLTLILFFEAIKEFPLQFLENKKISINFSDTLMELPQYEIYVIETLKKIEEYIQKQGWNIKLNKIKPERKHKFFNLILGKGQTLPRRDFRWCTDRLKILPQEKLEDMEEKKLTIIGARKEESNDRKKRLEKNSSEENKYIKKVNDNKYLFAPIEDLKLEDVWEGIFLFSQNSFQTDPQEWINFTDIYNLYKSATSNKDLYPDARFGCWLCPLVKKDQTLMNLVEKYPQYQPLLEFRDFIMSYQTIWSKSPHLPPLRDIYNHRNFKVNLYKIKNHRQGMISPGGYSLETRIMFYEKLLTTLKEVKNLDKKFPLKVYLDEEDIKYIQEIWFFEGDYNLTAYKKAKEILEIDINYTNLSKEVRFYKQFLYLYTHYYCPYKADEASFSDIRDEILIMKEFVKINKIDIKEIDLMDKVYFGDLIHSYATARKFIFEELREKGVYFSDSSFEYKIAEEWFRDEISFWVFEYLHRKGYVKFVEDKIRPDSLERFYNALEFMKVADSVEAVEENPFLTIEEKIEFMELNREGINNYKIYLEKIEKYFDELYAEKNEEQEYPKISQLSLFS